jgi:3-oxoacyl-[acyl-carrier-protein] synthase-3
MNEINLVITGVSTFVAEPMTIEEWADEFKVPDRHEEGKYLTGTMVEKILGIKSKSWAPEIFKDPEVVIKTAREAMDRVGVRPIDIDVALIVTCSPFQVLLLFPYASNNTGF